MANHHMEQIPYETSNSRLLQTRDNRIAELERKLGIANEQIQILKQRLGVKKVNTFKAPTLDTQVLSYRDAFGERPERGKNKMGYPITPNASAILWEFALRVSTHTVWASHIGTSEGVPSQIVAGAQALLKAAHVLTGPFVTYTQQWEAVLALDKADALPQTADGEFPETSNS
jgi:hypothetical protein